MQVKLLHVSANNSRQVILRLLLIFLLATCGYSEGHASEKSGKIIGRKMEAAEHAKHVKGEMPTTDKWQEKSRGSGYPIKFKNHTGYYINVYLDGYFKGTIAPYSSAEISDLPSRSVVYLETVNKTYNWTATPGCETYNFDLYVN